MHSGIRILLYWVDYSLVDVGYKRIFLNHGTNTVYFQEKIIASTYNADDCTCTYIKRLKTDLLERFTSKAIAYQMKSMDRWTHGKEEHSVISHSQQDRRTNYKVEGKSNMSNLMTPAIQGQEQL